MEQLVAQLTGPVAALAGALIAVVVLFRELRKAQDARMADVVKAKDEIIVDLRSSRDTAITGWREQTRATDRLADVIEERQKRRGG